MHNPRTPLIACLISVLQTMSCLAEELPADAQRLVEQRDKAIQRVEDTFAEELEKLKIAYTQRGDLEAANAIANLANTKKPDKKKRGEFDFTGLWQRSDGGKTTLHPGGRVSTDWSNIRRSWTKISNDTIRISFNGQEHFWTIGLDGKTLVYVTTTMKREN